MEAFPGQVILTEIMIIPEAAKAPAGCWVEVFNVTAEDMRMQGWHIVDGDGAAAAIGLPERSVIPPKGYALFGFDADPATNGGIAPALVLEGVALGSGSLALMAGEVEVDRVAWDADGAWPVGPGRSMSLDPASFNLMANDSPEAWCTGRGPYGDGDLGTPGRANDSCPPPAVYDDGEINSPDEECTGMTPSVKHAEDGTACGGSEAPGRYCVSGVCRAPVCGDAVKGPLEACDDGNQDPCDGCLPTCELHAGLCGDGFVCGPEECDDGNQAPGDGCSPACTIEQAAEPCPPDMVLVPATPGRGLSEACCIDRYEASRADATANSAGVDDSVAVSVAGVLPWTAKPMTPAALATFRAACAAAGKRLCTTREWAGACGGPEERVFVYGDTYDPEICNAVDTFCDDFCEAHGIAPCITTPNCGYTLSYSYPYTDPPAMHLTLTGTMPGCTNELGHFDIVGNAWEIVSSHDDPRGYEVRGGAWNCAGAAERHRCDFNAGWSDLWAGFRCCKEPEQ